MLSIDDADEELRARFAELRREEVVRCTRSLPR